jgi:hypothetical protein
MLQLGHGCAMADSHGELNLSFVCGSGRQACVGLLLLKHRCRCIDLVWGAQCRLPDVRVCRAAH